MIIRKHPAYLSVEAIVGDRTVLRKLEEGDLQRTLKWLRDPSVNKFLSQDFSSFTQEQEFQWFNFMKNSCRDIVFAIETKDEHIHIGNCGLHKINWIQKSCELGIVIGEKNFWNKGYGSDAIRSVVSFAFNRLGISRIRLNVYQYNVRAIRAYEKCGFKKIKTLKNDHLYEGKYWDTFVMELVKPGA
ncbi:MAG: GNAT family N-acetyltransferase [Actinobacteria bacterium]|nr:GNAT family N-acetyltransferase [Actinomycetota bacterium]